MGCNRKFVLEDDLQLAVRRTILRGPRALSVQWAGMRNTVSAASKPNQPKPEPQKKTPLKPCGKVPAARKEAVSPDEAVAAARQTMLAAFKKAQSQAQERPVSERIASTKSFISRSQKRVEQA